MRQSGCGGVFRRLRDGAAGGARTATDHGRVWTPSPNHLPQAWRQSMSPAERHAVSRNSSRPISMRRISLVPAPISYSLASRSSRPVG